MLLIGAAIAFAIAMIAVWPSGSDNLRFLRTMPSQPMGSGVMPFGAPVYKAGATLDEAFNVRKDYDQVLQAAQNAGYRITRHQGFALGEPSSRGPRLVFAAGELYRANRWPDLHSTGSTVVGIVSEPNPARSLLDKLGVTQSASSSTFGMSFDWGYHIR